MLKKSFWVIIFLFIFQTYIFGQTEKAISVGVLNQKAKILLMPKVPPIQPRIAGQVTVQVKIDLQTGKVVWAKAVSGHPLLRTAAEKSAKETKFEPALTEFSQIYATGILVYKVEDLNKPPIVNDNPQRIIADWKTAIVNGRAKHLEKPVYSKEANDNCANGMVEVLTLFHNVRGEVIATKAISGNELLFDSAEKAVMKSKFNPSNINGDNDFYVLAKVVYNFDSLSNCLSVGVVNKKAISLPKLRLANHFRINEEQIVAVNIIIDLSGKVTNASAIFGHPLLRQACENAARKAKFNPTLINSKPFKISALLVYKFKTDGTVETDIKHDDEILGGKAVNLINLPYTHCSCKFANSVSVMVLVEVDKQGNVTKANAISGHQVLRYSTEQAARSSKFLPINLKTRFIISYNFTEVDKWSVKFKDSEIRNVKILE